MDQEKNGKFELKKEEEEDHWKWGRNCLEK